MRKAKLCEEIRLEIPRAGILFEPPPYQLGGLYKLPSGVWLVMKILTGFNTEKRRPLPAVVTGIVIAILISLTTSE